MQKNICKAAKISKTYRENTALQGLSLDCFTLKNVNWYLILWQAQFKLVMIDEGSIRG